MREQILNIYRAGLAAVEGRAVVREALRPYAPGSGPVWLVAIGKAAAAMAAGAQEILGPSLAQGLVITKHGHGDPALPFELIEAGHPKPDADSLRAGERLLQFLTQVPEEASLLFLISGGASALVEALPEGMGLEALQRATDWLLGSGLAIDDMNRVRKALSRIKGGRLARQLQGRRTLNLMISDVPGDDMATIGSGLLVPSPAGPLPSGLPDWLLHFMRGVPPAPAADDPAFAMVESRVLANNHRALAAMAEQARAEGLKVILHESMLEGSVASACEVIHEAMQQHPGLHLWGGETTVELPPSPGRGGRNQHLALLLARAIHGTDGLVLCAGTDGTDGPTGDAGAMVDGHTTERGELHYDGGVAKALHGFDAGSFLEASGDLITTGPTGTNVMDVVLAYRP